MGLKHGNLTKIGQMFTIRKHVIREKMNIKNSVLDYIRYKQLTRAKDGPRKTP
jgi:hypothetical protein